ncbi:MBL fold metallo-hydrolase [Patescibacteria group bacterium]|nr:MBL fold metallo-hydrolase [Patescibacteria group bacterium]
MKNIKFLGAAGEVTGSSFLLTGETQQILVDLGMYQGTPELEEKNFLALDFDVVALAGVLLTHAHLDHCGRLPLLVKQGFNGQVFTTEPTKDIVKISLLDTASLAEEENAHNPIYTKEDVAKLCSKIQAIEYDQPFNCADFQITFRNAGHILGSASIEVSDKTGKIVFSGDLGNTPEDLIKPTEYITSADFVVMESTYGNSVHPQEDVSVLVAQEINEVEKSGATLLIPAFSIERTQEILHLIGQLKKQGKVQAKTPVFLDSPMAIEVTDIFRKYPKLYNSQTAVDADPFEFDGLTLTKTGQESRNISQTPGVKVIIAGSGMMNGGRILHHLQNYISQPETRLLIVGYQAVGTLGRKIEEGAQEVTIDGQHLPVKAHISKIESLSSHADQPKLLNWLKHIHGVKKVFINHGEDEQRQVLAEKIKSDLGINEIVLPQVGEEFELS